VMATSGWYQLLQSTRCIPPRRSPPLHPDTTSPYALAVGHAEFTNLKLGVYYRLHVYFYDKANEGFFGRPYYGEWIRSESNIIDLSDVLFFHSPIKDENIVIVVELVESEDPASQEDNLYTLSWTITPLFSIGKPITDFSTADFHMHISRLQLYYGSPKLLFFMSDTTRMSNSLRKAGGVLELCLQTHQRMMMAIDFLPEFCIVSAQEIIPGLQKLEGYPQLVDANLQPTSPCTLEDLTVSFGPHAEKLEMMFIELLNNDRLYRANKSPVDKDVVPMQVLERRLRIGIHNGFTYVEEPQCFHLSSLDEHITGTHSLRRKARPVSRSSLDLRSEDDTLFVRNNVSLKKLVADPLFAVVFVLDYLVGVKAYDGTVSSSQSVMLAWGAWCPFANGHTPERITIPLTGGPRLNPDETLCFKNLLRWRGNLSANTPFGQLMPRIHIRFRHSRIKRSKSEAGNLNMENVGDLRPNDWTRKSDVQSDVDEMTKSVKKVVEQPIPMPKPRKERQPLILPPIPFQRASLADDASVAESCGTINRLFEKQKNKEAHNIQYRIPAARISSIPHATLAKLMQTNFTPIFDRNGDKPTSIDVDNLKKANMSIELNDRLSTNEVIIQFLAIVDIGSTASHTNPPQSVFFTMNFYRFQQITSERLLVYRGNDDETQSQPCVLKRVGNDGKLIEIQGDGFTVKYTVDRNSIPDGEEDDFISYLLLNNLAVDVWDADSLLPRGCANLPLNCLMRQGCEAVQANLQVPVVESALPSSPQINFVLLVRIANVGHPSTKSIDLTHSRTSAIVSRRLNRLGQNEVDSYKIRAKPLSPIHETAMQRFLAAQKLDIKLRYEEIFNEDSLRRIRDFRNGQTAQKNLVTKGSLKRFIFHQELEAYKKLRNESKASKLLKAVFKAITTEHRIFPSFGEVYFFEFLLQNTEPEPINVIIEITEPSLSVVLDNEAWDFFKRSNDIHSPVERDLFNVTTGVDGDREVRIFLKAMEAIFVPFKYDAFIPSKERRNSEVKVVFKKCDTGEPIAIIDLIAEIRADIIDQSFRFIHEAEKRFSRIIRISGTRDNRPVLSTRCSDASALVTIKNASDGSQDLLITCYSDTSASLRSFLIFLYGDKYAYRLIAVWAIHLHCALPISVNAVQAQPVKFSLIFKTDSNDRLVQLFSSSSQIVFAPSQPFLTSNARLHEIIAHFTPYFTGEKAFLIAAVDTRSHQLLNQWILSANVEPPNILKSFHIDILLNCTETKMITINNEYNIARMYRIISSRPEFVRVDDEIVCLEARSSVDISITFLPLTRPLSVEVVLFVSNVENDLQEEAYLLTVNYYSDDQ
uniref:Nephrocystin-4 n=1 Tax=Parascaris univalens TaxID=6257 RepID=A0A915BZ95_PARUN